MKVLLYGKLAELLGREIEVATPPGATVGDVRHLLQDRSKAALAALGRADVMGCIDDQIVGDAEIVPKGKELAFLPILSGG